MRITKPHSDPNFGDSFYRFREPYDKDRFAFRIAIFQLLRAAR